MFKVGKVQTYNFSEMYAKLNEGDKTYTLSSISTIDELVDNHNLDISNLAYIKYGNNNYETDRKANVNILTLTRNGTDIYIPEKYTTVKLDEVGVDYANIVLTVNMGYYPVGYDLSILKEAIATKTVEITGVKPKIESMNVSKSTVMKPSEHQMFFLKLKKNIDEQKLQTDPITLIRFMNKYMMEAYTLKGKVRTMEEFIIKNINVLPSSVK